jgi:CTP-dependent riboflavin kinase
MDQRPEIQKRIQSRAEFMARLYESVDASVSTFVSAFEIADALGVSADEGKRIMEYLKEKGYIHIDDHKLGIIRITAAGIDHVETQE